MRKSSTVFVTVISLVVLAAALSVAINGATVPNTLHAHAAAPTEAAEQAPTTPAAPRRPARGPAGGHRSAGARRSSPGRPAGWLGERCCTPAPTTGNRRWRPTRTPVGVRARHAVRQPKPCAGNCPTPFIVLERSDDGGATWRDGVPLCACKGSGQFDPIIEVVPDTGHVYAI